MINNLSIFDLSSREKPIDGKSLVGKIAVAEAGDPVPVRASMPEQLREAGWKGCELGLSDSWPLDPSPKKWPKTSKPYISLFLDHIGPFSSPILMHYLNSRPYLAGIGICFGSRNYIYAY